MVKTCSQCQYTGEPTWRDGVYYCPACGAVIDMTTPSPQVPPQPAAAPAQPINAVCPICKNAANNTLVNGKCRCALCGTTFDYAAPVYTNNYASNYVAPGASPVGNAYAYQRRQELEKEKNRRLVWGIVWIFLLWPVSIYHFYKMYRANEELKKYSHWY